MTDMEPSNQPTPIGLGNRITKRNGVLILILALAIWGALIAFGSFQTQASTDIRRPLIVMAVLGTFIGIWACALLSKKTSDIGN